jgi:putative SbcD/Mre11-related phosphoesterase
MKLTAIEPLVDEPVLIAQGTLRVMVVCDIHLGIESDIQHSGIVIPSQSDKVLKRILHFIDTIRPERVVLLGDVKHNIPWISWQERKEVPWFLENIASRVPVDIVPGNHDGDMEHLIKLIPGNLEISLKPVKGYILDGVGYFHGHTWPAPRLLSCKNIVMAHNHPTIRFTDALGHSSSEPAWIRTKMNFKILKDHYQLNKQDMQWSDPDVIIMPAFCALCGGIAFNESKHDHLLGPVFSSGSIDPDKAEIYLLDGTRLGKLSGIRRLSIANK